MVLCAEFQQDAKFLKKFLEIWKRLLIFAVPFANVSQEAAEKIFKKDLVDSKITLIFAIPFATKMRSFFKLVLWITGYILREKL